jgi:hypothetical protein
MEQDRALPSEVFPSDHVRIEAKFELIFENNDSESTDDPLEQSDS